MRPLVFLHGSGDNASIWAAQLTYFQQQARRPAFALNLPGHGTRPDTLPDQASVEDYAQAVYDMLTTELQLQRPIIVGHSLGGAIALALALLHGADLGGLILIGSGARLRVHPALLEEAHAAPAQASKRLTELALAPSHVETLTPALLRTKHENDQHQLYRDLAACNAFDVMERLHEIMLPTLLICGDADRLTPSKYSTYLQQQLPHARLHIQAGAGHYVMYEQAQAVNQVIESWLHEIEDGE